MTWRKGIGLVVALLAVSFIFGCADENDPKYWAKKIKEPAYRETAIKRMGDIYNDALEKAKYDKTDPQVAKIQDAIVPVLLEAFNKYKTDNINRSNILTILAQVGDTRAIPAFEELLDYQEGINETDASKGAEALGKLQSDASIPKIIGMVRKAQVARKSRGEGSRNRPEEDWIARSAIEALRTILSAKPSSAHRDEAVDLLIDILGTSADEQDFFLNMKAAAALGDIGDPKAVSMLIRGLFMQGRGATIYQQCRVALTKIAIEHKKTVVDELLKAYKGENKDLEADAIKFQFIKGVKEDKLGRIFAELEIQDKEVLDAMMEKLNDPDPAVSGFTAISLGRLNYRPALPKMVEKLNDKDVNQGMVPGIVEAFEFYQAPAETSEALFDMMSNRDKWDGNFRLRGALALSKIATGDYLSRYQKAAAEEPDEEIRKQMVEFTERLAAAKDCGDDAACWVGKLKDPSWRVQEKALYTLFRLAGQVPESKVSDVTYMMRSANQDVLKVLLDLIPKLHPKGCVPSKSCERLKKIIPYWRAKPQFKVRANDAECVLAILLGRSGGKLSDMQIAGEDQSSGE
jgi:HEAT repeat protein